MSPACPCWDGSWVRDRLGLRVSDPAADEADTLGRTRAAVEHPCEVGDGTVWTFAGLAGLAVRRNDRRAHLVVSRVLGKHVPVVPAQAVAAGHALGQLVAARVGGSALVLGNAETATALGHLVADCLPDARYLHSTRRQVAGLTATGGFEEAHSHATGHLLLPGDPAWFATDRPVVIVDDELTTGRTAMAAIRQIQRINPRERYVVASLLDLRTEQDRRALREGASELGVVVDVVALVTASLTVPPDVLSRGRRLVDALSREDPVPLGRPSPVRRIDPPWPDGQPHGGQHGFDPRHRAGLDAALDTAADRVAVGLPERGPVLVLGTEELMYAPMRLAQRLASGRRDPIRFSSTTRSPILPLPEAGYPVRTRLSFAAHDPTAVEGPPVRYAYNVAPWRGGTRYAHVVVVLDRAADTPALWRPGGLVEGLRPVCGGVSVVVLPPAPVPVPPVSPPLSPPASSAASFAAAAGGRCGGPA